MSLYHPASLLKQRAPQEESNFVSSRDANPGKDGDWRKDFDPYPNKTMLPAPTHPISSRNI